MKISYYIVLCMIFLIPTAYLKCAVGGGSAIQGGLDLASSIHSLSNNKGTIVLNPKFIISQTNQDTSGLWIGAQIKNYNYILASNAPSNLSPGTMMELHTISSFLNNNYNVSVNDWNTNGVSFEIQGNGSDVYLLLQKNTTPPTQPTPPTPVAVQKLYYLTSISDATQVIWNGTITATNQVSASNPYTQAIQYIAGQNPALSSQSSITKVSQACGNGNQIIAPFNYVISPVTKQSINVGAIGKTDDLWLTMAINGTTYLLAKNASSGTIPGSPALITGTGAQNAQALYNAFQTTITHADWDGGIYFSFIESCGQVSLYVQDVTGKKLGEVVLPGVTNFAGINNQTITFGGTNITTPINVSCYQTLCLSNGTRGTNVYMRIPSNVLDQTFTPGSLSSIATSKFNLPDTSNLWLTMTINGTQYVLAQAANSGSAPKKPTPTTTTPADITHAPAYIENLSPAEWHSGVYFNFVKINNQLFLNIQSTFKSPSLSQAFLIPGATNINGYVAFGGTSIQNAISVSPYQTLGLTTGNSNIGPCYQFSNAKTILATNTAPLVCSYYQSPGLIVKGGNFNNAGLWIRMTLNGTKYILVWDTQHIGASMTAYGTLLDQTKTFNNALLGVSQADWNNGIIFAFIENKGQVYINAMKVNGTLVGSAVLPSNITKISDIQSVSFDGSSMQSAISIDPAHDVFGLTTSTALPATFAV